MVNKGVWTPVIEKAFAKLYGNYSALVGYWSQIAIANLIGTPGFKIYIYNPVLLDYVFNLKVKFSLYISFLIVLCFITCVIRLLVHLPLHAALQATSS